MNQRFVGIIIALVSLITSCNGDRIYEEYQGLKTGNWDVADTVSFEVNQLSIPNRTLIGIKYNKDYEFRNLYLRYILKDSLDQTVESKLLDIPLFDSKNGKPLGEGYGSTFTKYDTLPIENAYYSIHLLQYMRVEKLSGIETVGVKVVKK
ncbi:gliding motility lipoprotein GldH [Aquiflexum gelatinilyticum]|uniref:gliding motility lipoprotein GldH n=1 Tax=Aquiflexum gelatinilyticum TaxID=2961943 RepID=UPI00216A6EF1|nr:gliding motility lipoprotein GldH [Aquiflexum gelatinilyticum]MCS4435398.1 gliding motility lipoprotein GldH [Aquiflexum gelatinilyticum]